jgi:predicted ATPase with chaperone activity
MTIPTPATATGPAKDADAILAAAMDRINRLPAHGDRPAPGAGPPAAAPREAAAFTPAEPASFRDAGLTDSMVEELAMKFLLSRGDATGREIADQVKLPFVLVDRLLRDLKAGQMVGHRGAAPMNDFQYQLSDLGRERARRYSERCTYFGAAPVSLKDYVESVNAQSLTNQHPTPADLSRAFEGLVLGPAVLNRLGPAINSGRGVFLYGPPGNGKTSIAERITSAFGREIWIPRCVGVDGEIIRIFDPVNHVEAPLTATKGLIDQRTIDHRWVRIVRPTIVVGGELTMAQLEVARNTTTGISEAPLQLKSNCGSLVIDDFGRQRMHVSELLNRWIVPLEKRRDYLNLPNGRNVVVPFDQLVVFATNLEPRELVDEAFLRRIPYKIEVHDPTEEQFIQLFETMGRTLGVAYCADAVRYLIAEYFRKANRPMRFCHPRDLLLQIRSNCTYQHCPAVMTNEAFDQAVDNYFSTI